MEHENNTQHELNSAYVNENRVPEMNSDVVSEVSALDPQVKVGSSP